ncbi:MAG: hypothetical protein ACKVVT_03030 [Dehalococcoidia bacterium]
MDILPFLMSANDAGIVCMIIFLASSIVFTIPVFATRGMTQVMWLGAVSVVMLIELVLMVTFVVLISQGEINPKF